MSCSCIGKESVVSGDSPRVRASVYSSFWLGCLLRLSLVMAIAVIHRLIMMTFGIIPIKSIRAPKSGAPNMCKYYKLTEERCAAYLAAKVERKAGRTAL